MAKYLFVVPPFFGHISPTLSAGASLLARGHEVHWFGIKPLKPAQVPPGGLFIVPEKELKGHQSLLDHILKRQDDGPKLSGAESWKLALEETYIPFCHLMMPGLEQVVDEFGPDVIISDCITFAGGLCAYKKGIPYVTSTPVPPNIAADKLLSPRILEWQLGLMFRLQKDMGIEADELVIHSKSLNVVFTSAEFADIRSPEPHMRFVGPVEGRPNAAPFDWERLAAAKGPKVYVSLGTLLEDIRLEFFSKLVEAFAGEPLTIVAATDPGIRASWPDNFIVQGFVPQAELLPHMDAVICHGGFNTVNDAFMNGLPMLITPIAYDHFHTAGLIEKAGCGLKLRYKRLRIPDLKQLLWTLLDDQSYREAACRIRETFGAAGGNTRVVQLLEELVV